MLGYPTSLEDTPTLILQSFMSGTPASTQAVNAYWHFAGFALGQAYPHVAMGDAISLIHQDGTVLLSEDEFKAGLQSLSVVTTGDTPTVGFSWASLALTALTVLLRLLQG